MREALLFQLKHQDHYADDLATMKARTSRLNKQVADWLSKVLGKTNCRFRIACKGARATDIGYRGRDAARQESAQKLLTSFRRDLSVLNALHPGRWNNKSVILQPACEGRASPTVQLVHADRPSLRQSLPNS